MDPQRATSAPEPPVASIGTVGDSYDNAQAKSLIGLDMTELVRQEGSWKGVDDLELATLDWVHWAVSSGQCATYLDQEVVEDFGWFAPVGGLPGAAVQLRRVGVEVGLMIASGAVGPGSEPRPEAERQLRLRAHNICSLANNFAAFGFYQVLHHVVPNRHVLDLMVGLLTPRPVLFVTLAPTLELAAARNDARPSSEQVHGTFAALRQEMADELSSMAGGSTPPH